MDREVHILQSKLRTNNKLNVLEQHNCPVHNLSAFEANPMQDSGWKSPSVPYRDVVFYQNPYTGKKGYKVEQ